jgi:enoyl-CoA hydratase
MAARFEGVAMPYKFILTGTRDRVGIVTINRPQAMNALNAQLVQELADALLAFDADETIGAMVVTGNEKVFAAGADIKEMAEQDVAEMMAGGFISSFGRLQLIRKPLIAAVSGWALGGGFEIALACDLIVASESARFGQPEVTIGVIPGAGATQRLTRATGKAIAMEIILNNRILSAQEALQLGIANRVVTLDRCLEEAILLAHEIASRAPLAVAAAKRLINQAYETTMADGLQHERDEFHQVFDSEDRREGMSAFIEKRAPRWIGK